MRAGLSALLLLFFIFFLIRWCRASRKKKRKARRGSGLAREMLAASGDSRTSVPKTTVNMQNLSSITSFSDCGKQASSPLLNSSGFSPIYNGVPPEQRDLYRPSAGSSRQAATPHVAVGSSSDAGVFKVRSFAFDTVPTHLVCSIPLTGTGVDSGRVLTRLRCAGDVMRIAQRSHSGCTGKRSCLRGARRPAPCRA